MRTFSRKQHQDALLRRRIKFVVEKGAMARLFKKGSHVLLQDELYRRIRHSRIASIRTQTQYDAWIKQTVNLRCWRRYSRNGLAMDRWAYFAKLINIIVYEVVTNRDLFYELDWRRLCPYLHIPIDDKVLKHLGQLDNEFPALSQLKGMKAKDYWRVQWAARTLANKAGVPPIWFEAAWSE